ncbi:hypothetical protein KsCSTR_29800 [Candidatus Kuenenia stuttgartiensis]|jgi:hypothetical protein|uniref:Uncharacterized protein n=1 Tax=Kuenenia stuttgartiensis TaxID=174633 RepID=Q1Q5L9_KUEST|nr:hypothetical protein [Candidatus Kuenenia stuttgartiensis]QII12359.1 hypothetical protein KsCSTR_29800 [Candidatus Kuenenia stuttgartiensis]CAJ75317.1 hypothetical protein kuste4555 [Candidatus Kuenenia stuttgartiensis]
MTKKDIIVLEKLEKVSSQYDLHIVVAKYVSLVPDIGAKGEKFMTTKTKNKIKYTDEPLGEIRIIDDFLPSPEELV